MNNNIRITCFLLLALTATLGACRLGTYKYKGTDFGSYYYHPNTLDNSFLSKFNEGIYLFEMCDDVKIVGTDETVWYNDCDSISRDSGERKDLLQYSFFTFIDGCRVIYYTSYTDEGFNFRESYKDFAEDTTLSEDYSEYFYIEPNIDFLKNNYRYSLRGYYTTEVELVNGHRRDTLIKMNMEKIISAKKNRFVEFTFRYHNGAMELRQISTLARTKAAKSTLSIYHPEKIFSIKPIYRPIDYSINLFIQQNPNKKTPESISFNRIEYLKDPKGGKSEIIYYKNNSEEVFRESVNDLQSW